MKISLKLIIISIISSSYFQAFSQESTRRADPLAHTYSIIARDPATGQMAVAVQSHWFSVGTLVSWGRSGVGVVATQSFVNASYGLRGLDLLEEGKTATEALQILLSTDEGKGVRQAAIIDTSGNVAAHTGEKCIPFASHIVDDNFSVQANMMLTEVVPEAMARAYKSNVNLPFAERVVSALMAAQEVGGDIRGKQSAVLIVVSGDPDTPEWSDKLIDLRVDDSQEPLKELLRLLKVQKAYEHMNKGDLAVEHGDMSLALKEYGTAEKLMPDNLEMKFWKAVSLANNGDTHDAAVILRGIYSDDQYGENWRQLLKRLPPVGLLNVEEEDLQLLINPE